MSLSLQTKLQDLQLPHWDMILDEKFLLNSLHPNFSQLETIEDLVRLSDWSKEATLDHLDWLLKTIPILEKRGKDFTANPDRGNNLIVTDGFPSIGEGFGKLWDIRSMDFVQFKKDHLLTPVAVHSPTARQNLSASLYLCEEGFTAVAWLATPLT